jgi:hypothetical protein
MDVGEGNTSVEASVMLAEQSPLSFNTHVRLREENPLGSTSHYGRTDKRSSIG